jgi:putative hydrolase of the HAD superfamily
VTIARPVRGVLFDIDDTLVDTASAFAAGLGEAFDAVAELDEAQHADAVRIWRADAGGHFRRYVAGEVDLLTQRRARVAEIVGQLSLRELDDDAFAAWEHAYQAAFAASWALFDDAHACVASAVDDGLAVGVVTNAPGEQQRAKIAAVGLSDVLTHLVGVDSIGVGKPDPRVFHEGCRLIGTEPAETIYVGDELDTDARAAVDAGLIGVWIDRPGRRRGGPHEVTDEMLDEARRAGVVVIGSLSELPDVWSSGQTPST